MFLNFAMPTDRGRPRTPSPESNPEAQFAPGAIDPAALHIVSYPEPVLRRPTMLVPVTKPGVLGVVRVVAERMLQLMDEAEGIGLAAPQVGLPWQMFVVNVPESDGRSARVEPPTATGRPVVYINPQLGPFEGPPEPAEEGCLSLPDIRGDVLRPPIVTIRAIDHEGEPIEQRAGGLLARCWQHEFDHLQGVLIIDKMTQLSRMKVRSALRDLER